MVEVFNQECLIHMGKLFFQTSYKVARRIIIAVVGTTVVLIGVAMLVLPGPAFIVIPTGLAILGLEFAWARHWLIKIKERTQEAWANHRYFRRGKHQNREID
jgi:tellurite resistance protein TerC